MNSEDSIVCAQRSISSQTYSRELVEWIVVDGGSTDRTLELIQNEEFKPDKLVSEPDGGIYDALNKGVRMATGDTVGFLHADDFLASEHVLERISGAFEKSRAEAIYGDLQYVKPLKDGGYGLVRHWGSGIYHRQKLNWGWMPPHPALYLKREIYERTKLATGEYFDTSYTCAADYDFMMRILATYQVEPAYLGMVLVKMRVGGISNRRFKHVLTKSKEDWQVIRRNRIGNAHTLLWKNVSKLKQFSTKE